MANEYTISSVYKTIKKFADLFIKMTYRLKHLKNPNEKKFSSL